MYRVQVSSWSIIWVWRLFTNVSYVLRMHRSNWYLSCLGQLIDSGFLSLCLSQHWIRRLTSGQFCKLHMKRFHSWIQNLILTKHMSLFFLFWIDFRHQVVLFSFCCTINTFNNLLVVSIQSWETQFVLKESGNKNQSSRCTVVTCDFLHCRLQRFVTPLCISYATISAPY